MKQRGQGLSIEMVAEYCSVGRSLDTERVGWDGSHTAVAGEGGHCVGAEAVKQ